MNYNYNEKQGFAWIQNLADKSAGSFDYSDQDTKTDVDVTENWKFNGTTFLHWRFWFSESFFVGMGLAKNHGYLKKIRAEGKDLTIGKNTYKNTSYFTQAKVAPYYSPSLGIGYHDFIFDSNWFISYGFFTTVIQPKVEIETSSSNSAVLQSDLDYEAKNGTYSSIGLQSATSSAIIIWGIGYRF